MDEKEIQRRYYAESATRYDAMHVGERDEHHLALSMLLGLMNHYKIQSILDIGSGTGRAVSFFKSELPGRTVVGIEPVQELREVGYRNGLDESDLIEGDVMDLRFEDNSFDLVCAFGVMHHVRYPELAVAEMLRVAATAIFISDSNNFGQGSALLRGIKQFLRLTRLWPLANLIKTRGRGYMITEGDGLAYSYSLFDNYKQISSACKEVHLMNTIGSGPNLLRSASHLAMFGVVRDS